MIGIYLIKNKINNKIYVGSAARSFRVRFNQHKSDLRKNKHRNIHLQRSYNKHGSGAFEYIVLEIVSNTDNILKTEQYYIDTLLPDYNIDKIAGSPLGRKLTKEQKEKFKIINKGIPFPEESRKKMSLAKKGKPNLHNKGKKFPRDKPILRDDGKIYPNIMTAAKDLKVKENTVIKACTDTKMVRRVSGYVLKYIKLDKKKKE